MDAKLNLRVSFFTNDKNNNDNNKYYYPINRELICPTLTFSRSKRKIIRMVWTLEEDDK